MTVSSNVTNLGSAAPLLGDVRRNAAMCRVGRFRRRGPRSVDSMQLRQFRFSCSRLVLASGGEFPEHHLQINVQAQPFNIFCCNLRSVLGKFTELCYVLDRFSSHLVLLQETWLDASTEHVCARI